MFYTLPSPLFTRRQTSIFRLGPQVPFGGVNLAYVSSVALDIQENLQPVTFGDLIPDNEIQYPEITFRNVNGVFTPYSAYDRDQVAAVSSLALTDTVFVTDGDRYAARRISQGGTAPPLARYKAYAAWGHVESIDFETIGGNRRYYNEHVAPLPSSNIATWELYLGSRMQLTTSDGVRYQHPSAIYIRLYDVIGADTPYFLNLFRVMVYISEIPEDGIVRLRYDKGEIRGRGTVAVVGYEQEYDEILTFSSVIPEYPGAFPRTWHFAPGLGPVINPQDCDEFAVAVYPYLSKVQVTVPFTADNYAPWFVNIRKGSFTLDTNYADVISPLQGDTFSGYAVRCVQDVLFNKFAATFGAPPVDQYHDVRISFLYSTEEYSRIRQGDDYSSEWALARSRGALVRSDTVSLENAGVAVDKPIVVLIRETVTEVDDIIEKWYAITNLPDLYAVKEELAKYTAQASYLQGLNQNVEFLLPILTVQDNTITYDSTINGMPKVFLPDVEARAFYYYKNDQVQYTGFTSQGTFYPCDVNPAMGHFFAGSIRRNMEYDRARNVWKSGIGHVAVATVRLYDTTTNDLIPSGDWMSNSGTNVLIGEFEISSTHTGVMIICSAEAIPSFNLFSMPLYLKMLPYAVRMQYPYDPDQPTAGDVLTIPMYDYTEKIVFETKVVSGNYVNTAVEQIILAAIHIVPNTIYGQNVLTDTRSRGGGLREDLQATGGEKHFWDIGCMDGQAYTGNQVIVLELPMSVKDRFLEAGMAEDEIEQTVRAKLSKYVAKGSLVLIQYV